MDSGSQQRKPWPYYSPVHSQRPQQEVSTTLFPVGDDHNSANKKPLHLEPFLSSNRPFVQISLPNFSLTYINKCSSPLFSRLAYHFLQLPYPELQFFASPKSAIFDGKMTDSFIGEVNRGNQGPERVTSFPTVTQLFTGGVRRITNGK